jgi:hypothetical protein
VNASALPTDYEYTCWHWDETADAWDDSGCTTSASTSALLTCACTHLTDFIAVAKAVCKSE